MKTNYYKEVFWLLAFGALFGMYSIYTRADETTWREKMQGLHQSLGNLLTYMSSDEEYLKAANQDKIIAEMKLFSEQAHHLDQTKMTNKKNNNADPSLPILSGYLKDDAELALRAFKDGRKNYSRNIMRAITSNCIACHTRNAYGPQFESINFEPNAATLKPLERAQFYAASRQFDRSVEEFIIISNNKKSTPWEKDEAVKNALAIAVRVKKDPALAEKIIQGLLKDESAPYYAKKDAESWKASIAQWKNEPKKNLSSGAQLFAEASRLLEQARKAQKFPMDHSADILYLRASATLFDLLQAEPNGKHVAKAFQLQGISYEALNPRSLENLNQLFYESCIKKDPHTALSEDCYKRLEESIYIGFTGSAGTDIPQAYKSKLLELWSVAIPKSKLKANPND